MRFKLSALLAHFVALLLLCTAVYAAEPSRTEEADSETQAFIEQMKQERMDFEQQELKLAEIAAKLATLPYFQQRLAETAPKPTGDALFDRYCSEVWRLNATNAYIGAGLDTAAALPDELLAQWEGEYGSDPRYWQLRYFCAEQSAGDWLDATLDPTLKAEQDSTLRFLEEGLARGVYDAALLQELFDQRLKAITDHNPYVNNLKFTVLPDEAAQLKPLTDKLTSEFSDETSSWYSKAIVDFALGDQQAALADLKRSLDCPSRSALEVFPLSVALKGVIAGEAPGSEYICGMLLGSWGGYSNRLAVLDRQCRGVADAALVSLEMQDMQTLITFGLQVEHSPEYTAVAAASAMLPSRELSRKLLVESPERLSPAQRLELLKLHGQIQSKCIEFAGWQSGLSADLIFPPKVTDYMFPLFAGLEEGEEMQYMLPMLIMFALDKDNFGKEFLDQDLGWGLWKASYDMNVMDLTEHYEQRMDRIGTLAAWDWVSMSFDTMSDEEMDQALAEKAAARAAEAE